MKKITYTFLGWKVHQFCFEQELEQNLWSALNFTQRFDFIEDAGSQKTSKVMLMGASGCWLVVFWTRGAVPMFPKCFLVSVSKGPGKYGCLSK